MTDAVDPSLDTTIDHRLQAIGQRYGLADWVVPTDRDLAAGRIGLSSPPLNAYDISTSGSSLDVTIDTGEAVVEGRYLARDVTTNVTLSANTANQTVYVGSNDPDTNTVTIGLDGAFGSNYSRVPIWDVTTGGSGVTSTTDRRRIGEPVDGTWHHVTDPADGVTATSTTSGIDIDTGELTRAWDKYRIVISHENHAGGEQELNIRINDVTASDYEWDRRVGVQNDFDSEGPASGWGDIARAGSGEIALQTLEIARPRAVAAPVNQYPVISVTTPGVANQRDNLHAGVLTQDPGLIDQIRVFGGSNSTGRVRIYGADS